MIYSRATLISSVLAVSANGQLIPKPEKAAPSIPKVNIPWTHNARLCGLTTTKEDGNFKELLDLRKKENCNVIELDSGLSYYKNDAEFEKELKYLNEISTYVKELGMKSVVYIPTLEVQLTGGCNDDNKHSTQSFMHTKKDQLQQNLAGHHNSFCGNQEHWVNKGEESAWFDPNNADYRAHFLGRVKRFAKETNLNGLWGDVPIFSDTTSAVSGGWFGAGNVNKQLFLDWAKEHGYDFVTDFPKITEAGDNGGISTPLFRAWSQWRHYTLDDWQDSITKAGEEGDKDFIFAAEVYSTDYMDGMIVGLDGGYKKNKKQFRVWEIDSVANTKAMISSTREDFRNKIAMNKYAVAADDGQHTWLFAYGEEWLDQTMVLGAIAGVGASPFEADTPSMTDSVNSTFREVFYGFMDDMDATIYDSTRKNDVGVLYSSLTRDHGDYANNCYYGMFSETRGKDKDHWSKEAGDSVVACSHLGAYRGTMNVLGEFQTTHKVVIDTHRGMQSLEGLKMLFVPSVTSMKKEAAQAIENFVNLGGSVVFTGDMPAVMDEIGNQHDKPLFANSLLKLKNAADNYENSYGKGKVFYYPEVKARTLLTGSVLGGGSNPEDHKTAVTLIRTTVASMAARQVTINNENDQLNENLYVEVGKSNHDDTESIYILNLEGFKQPLLESETLLKIQYNAPKCTKVKGASIYTPDKQNWSGVLEGIEQVGDSQTYNLPPIVLEQFSIIVMDLEVVCALPNEAPGKLGNPAPVAGSSASYSIASASLLTITLIMKQLL